jgi:hypothetical protein
MDNFNFSFPINIIKKEQRIVSGIATADNVDKSNDVVDFTASEIAFKNWQGNIREMHAPIAVGKAISYKPVKMKDADGKEYNAIEVEAYISKGAESTWQKILDGTLRAFSIGGKIMKKEILAGKLHNNRPINIIKEYELGELSLVDNPANALATIDLVKINTDGKLDYVLKCCDGVCECVAIEKKQPLKDPKGGLTAAGRRHFKQTEGANLKPGVKGPANTPEKMRRKGSFLTRFFTNPSGPMKDEKGRPTRLALSAAAWGEPVPQNMQDAAKLAAKGRRLLERYKNMKKEINENSNTSGKELLNDVNYDKVINMDETLTGDKLSLIKKFINWVIDSPDEDSGLEKSDNATEALIEDEVSVEQVEDQEMDIEVLKETLGAVIDQKLTDFAKSLKEEVDANVAAKIEEVSKSVEVQKEELAAKLTATEVALQEQTAKVEQMAAAGAMKKSVDSEDEGEVLVKSEPKAESFWKNVYLDQSLIESLGYKS